MTVSIRPEVQDIQNEIVKTRRDIHKHPEMGFEVHRTAAIVAERLKSWGIDTNEKVGKTGVVGMLRGQKKGPTIALRADMDALPIHETTNTPYQSVNAGVMHACGHDGHTAMLLAVARILAGKKENLKGNVRFIFQPAEEEGGGAKYMIKDGCLDAVDEIYGIHLWNYEKYGWIGSAPGPVLAAADAFTIKVTGTGGHGALPQGTVDAIVVSSQLITGLQTIVSRNINPLESAVVTIGTINGGDSHNVIAASVEMRGTVRSFSAENRSLIKSRMAKIVKGTEKTFRAKINLYFDDGYPPTINDPQACQKLMNAATQIVGDGVRPLTPFMGGEDFSYYAQKVPGCLFFVGSSPRGKEPGSLPHHCSDFDIEERALLVGSSVFIELIETLLIR